MNGGAGMEDTTKQDRTGRIIVIVLSVLVFLAIVWKTTKWEFLSIINEDYYFILSFYLILYFIIGFTILILILIWKKQWSQIIYILMFSMLLFLPWSNMYESARFIVLKGQMEKVAEQIMEKEYDTIISNKKIKLSFPDHCLSRGGQAEYIHEFGYRKVRFFQFKGVTTHSCYTYIKRDIEKENRYGNVKEWGETESIFLGGNWYYNTNTSADSILGYRPKSN